jgi:glycerophosphoryl diester phosphodiesterase family protein
MTSPHDEVPQGPTWAAPAGTGATPDQQPPPAPPAQPAQPGWQGAPASPPPGWGTPPGAGWGGPPPPGSWGPAGPPPPGALWRPPALQPGIIPLRPLGLGEIYDGAFRAIRANPRVMFGLAALVVTIAVALQSLVAWYTQGLLASQVLDVTSSIDPSGSQGLADSWGTSLGSFIALPITSIATTVLTGLLIVSVSKSVLGQVVGVGQVIRSPRVWLVVAFSFLLFLAEVLVAGIVGGAVVGFALTDQVGAAVLFGVVGALALFVAAFWVTVRTLLVAPALMLEGKKLWSTVGRAWRLTRGSFWRLLGIYLLTVIMASIIGYIFQVPAALITSFVFRSTTSFGAIVVTGIANVIALTLSTTFVAAVTALLYIDVRMRREGLDIELARAAEQTA